MKFDAVDKSLSVWIRRTRVEKNLIFTDDILIKKALRITEEKNIQGFKASSGLLGKIYHWKKELLVKERK